jgi:DNA-3-methyladenine glycosylase II
MTYFLHTDADLDKALRKLIKSDPRLKPVLAKAGQPTLRRREAGFAGLCAIVVGQQLSTASARAIWGRLAAAFDPFHHDALRRARPAKLARVGLSKPKIRTLKALGGALAKGAIDLEAVGAMDADDAHNALIALHGVGPWTADIYLLFCLGHADAFPAGDLALQEAARLAFGLKARSTAKEMIALAEAWRPWRGVAAHLLWAYYAAVKRREGAPVQPKTKERKRGNRRRSGHIQS